MNALIDTNVLLSAALRDRLPETVVLHVAIHDDWKWLVTPEILEELFEVLRRPKFKLSDEMLERWSELVSLRAINVGSPPDCAEFPRDPKDAPFLAAALVTEADLLVTGDRDLLDIETVGPTRVITVADFAADFLS